MARRALWRNAPGDPQTALGWFFVDTEIGRLAPTVALLVGIALVSLALTWSPWVLLGLPLVLLHVRRPEKAHDLSTLATLPSPGPAFACHIHLLTDVNARGQGTFLGADTGIATFVDGWLHVAGRRTDFALRRADLASAQTAPWGVRLDLPNGPTLFLLPLDARDTERLSRVFKLWSSVDSMPQGEPLLPPDRLHPTGLARAWHGALTSVAGLLALLAVMIPLHQGTFFVFCWSGSFLGAFRRLAEVRRLAHRQNRALPNETRNVFGH